MEDFAAIRRVKDRQVLITRVTDRDSEDNEIPGVKVEFVVPVGRAAVTFGFDTDEKADKAFKLMSEGTEDKGIERMINEQCKAWGGA